MVKQAQRWPNNLSADKRMEIASDRVNEIISRTTELVHLHEANRIICFSDQLSSQIPKSYAANAFQLFSGTMHQSEISRLCAIWDPERESRISLPTVSALVDDEEVKACLKGRVVDTRRKNRKFSAPEEDPERLAWLHKKADRRALDDATKNTEVLERGIAAIAEVTDSKVLKAARDFRNLHLAHWLDEKARKHEDLRAAYGDTEKLLDLTIPVIKLFDLGVNNSGFDWDSLSKQATECTQALWHGCKFNVLK